MRTGCLPPLHNRPKSHQPSGREWFRELVLFSTFYFFYSTPYFPFGEGFTPPLTPLPGPGGGGPRSVRASVLATRAHQKPMFYYSKTYICGLRGGRK